MKKELFVMAAAGMLAMASGCSTITQAETVSESAAQTTADGSGETQIRRDVQEISGEGQTETSGAEETIGSRVLIAYFSRWGNTDYPENVDAGTSASIVADENGRYGTTEYMAKMIQNVTGGDLYLIHTEETYPVEFQDVVDQGHRETDEGVIPALKGALSDVSGYDVVFVGYPVWATDVPRAIHSFLQAADTAGKIVIPFCTHDGYGADCSYTTVAGLCPGAEILEGLAVEAEDVPGAGSQVADWIGRLGIMEKLSQVSSLWES